MGFDFIQPCCELTWKGLLERSVIFIDPSMLAINGIYIKCGNAYRRATFSFLSHINRIVRSDEFCHYHHKFLCMGECKQSFMLIL